jgi:hypothetical protein
MKTLFLFLCIAVLTTSCASTYWAKHLAHRGYTATEIADIKGVSRRWSNNYETTNVGYAFNPMNPSQSMFVTSGGSSKRNAMAAFQCKCYALLKEKCDQSGGYENRDEYLIWLQGNAAKMTERVNSGTSTELIDCF